MTLFSSGYLYGCRKVYVKPASGSWTEINTPIDFTFNEVPSSNELRAGDVIKATHTTTEKIEWELNFGGFLLDEIAQLTGRTMSTSGTGTAQRDYFVANEDDSFPYFELVVRAVSDDGGGCWVHILKAQLTQAPNGQFRQNEFWVTNVKGKGVVDANGDFYKMYLLETDAEFPTS